MQWLIRKSIMNRLLLDTNFIIALIDSKDQYHKKALEIESRIKEKEIEIICMDCIVNEVYSVIARKLIERKMSKEFSRMANLITNFFKNIDIINAYRYLPRIHSKVINLMGQTEGRLNYHDALIALSSKQENIKKIVTLDNDFDEIKWLARVC